MNMQHATQDIFYAGETKLIAIAMTERRLLRSTHFDASSPLPVPQSHLCKCFRYLQPLLARCLQVSEFYNSVQMILHCGNVRQST